VPNPPQIGNEKGCYVVPMSLDPNSKEEIILQYHLPGTSLNDDVLNRLPFSYNTLNYDSDLQTMNFSQQLHTLTLEIIEKRENLFLNEHHFEAVAVARSEGFIRVFPVIPVLNSPQNL
jgi:hypothetical protein